VHEAPSANNVGGYAVRQGGDCRITERLRGAALRLRVLHCSKVAAFPGLACGKGACGMDDDEILYLEQLYWDDPGKLVIVMQYLARTHRLHLFDRIAELGGLTVACHLRVVNFEQSKQQEAYNRLRELGCPTRPLPTGESEEYYAFYFDKLVELSGIKARHQKKATRDAFDKLMFRCLRKAYAPGQSATKRLRKAYEHESWS